jgi:hypothetical protein
MNGYFIIFIILVLLETWVARALSDLGGRLRPPINNYIYIYKLKAQKKYFKALI